MTCEDLGKQMLVGECPIHKDLTPYDEPENWLTRKELLATMREGIAPLHEIAVDFDIEYDRILLLLEGKISKIKLGRNSPLFETEIWVSANKFHSEGLMPFE